MTAIKKKTRKDNIYLKSEMLESVSQTAGKILTSFDLTDIYSKGVAIQELINVSYKDTYKDIIYPEVRFLLFENGYAKMEVLGK